MKEVNHTDAGRRDMAAQRRLIALVRLNTTPPQFLKRPTGNIGAHHTIGAAKFLQDRQPRPAAATIIQQRLNSSRHEFGNLMELTSRHPARKVLHDEPAVLKALKALVGVRI